MLNISLSLLKIIPFSFSVKFHFFLPCAKYFGTVYKFERSHSHFNVAFIPTTVFLSIYSTVIFRHTSHKEWEVSFFLKIMTKKVIWLAMVLWLVNWLVSYTILSYHYVKTFSFQDFFRLSKSLSFSIPSDNPFSNLIVIQWYIV